MAKGMEERVLGLIRGEKLVRRGDRVLISVSGGKDSAVAAWILAKHAEELGINVGLMHIDLGIPNYSKKTRNAVEELAKALNVPLYVHEIEKEWGMPLPRIVRQLRKASCYICGILKRYYQNALARELRYNVLATGHNLDDSVGFIVNNFITGQTEYIHKISPVLPETELTPRKIKPLFWIQGREILEYARENNVPFIACQCPFQKLSPTHMIRETFDRIEEIRPGAKKSLVKNVWRAVPEKKERTKPNACKYCGAPTLGKVCAVCRIKKKVGIKPGPVRVQKMLHRK